MLRDYESIFILAPNLDEAEAGKLALKMQEVVTGNGGEIVKVEKWGKRRLAYEIGKHKKGDYILIQFRGEAVTVAELERNYKMTESVIKFLTIRLEKEALAHLERQAAAEAAALKPESAEAPAEAVAAPAAPATEETAAAEETAEAAG